MTPFLSVSVISLLSITSPLSSCGRSGSSSPQSPIYTVAKSDAVQRDSVNASLSGSRRNAITTAVAKASPAVVGINVTAVVEQRVYDPFEEFYQMDPMFRQLFRGRQFGGVQKYQVKALGSGFLISSDGYILTNDHVAGNAAKIIVTTTDGQQYDAKLIGTDKTADVSLLKIDGDTFPFLRLGNSDDLSIGEWAIAMGNPFGLFEINDKPTVTVGVVSNSGVNLGLEEGRNYRGMIQTDAAISSGNSGGPLLNANGEVIGMNAVIRSTATNMNGESGSIGLGFAIPINKIKHVVDQLKSGVKLNHDIGDLGFHVSDLDDRAKQYFKIKTDKGIVVTDVIRGSVAERAGLEVGDLITSIDNEKVRRGTEFESVLAEHLVGDVVKLHVERPAQTSATPKQLDLKMKLGN